MSTAPTTKPGRVAVALLAGCAAIFAVAIAVSLVAEGPNESSAFDVYRFVVGVGFLATGAGAAAIGLAPVVRDRERSMSVLAAIALGLLAVAFALGDVVFG